MLSAKQIRSDPGDSTAPVCDRVNLCFWGTAAVLTLLFLGHSDFWGSEPRWGEVVREMLASRDYFTPTINGTAYFDKPLLSYWLIAAVARITGGVSEWSVRLPSAVEALAALAATRSLGRRLWGAEVAEVASWLLLASYGFLIWARTGQADMGNLAVVVVAMAWYWQRRDRPGFATYLVFYLIIAVGAQLKGLAALVLPLILVLADAIRSGRWRMLYSARHVAAASLGAVVFLAPDLVAFAVNSGQAGGPEPISKSLFGMMMRENVERYLEPFDHVEPFYVYFRYLPTLLLPWAPLLTAAAAQALRPGFWQRLQPNARWLAIACTAMFVFFTASGSRRDYYILPILPFAALWMGLYATGRLGHPGSLPRRAIAAQRILLAALAGAEIAAGAAMPWVATQMQLQASHPLEVCFIAVGVATLPFALGFGAPAIASVMRLPRDLTPALVTALLLFAGYFCVQQPLIESVYGDARGFAALILAAHPPNMGLAFYRHEDDPLLFYLHQPEPVPVLNGPTALAARVTPSRPLMLLGRRDDLNELASAALPRGTRLVARISRSGNAATYDDDRAGMALVIEAAGSDGTKRLLPRKQWSAATAARSISMGGD